MKPTRPHHAFRALLLVELLLAAFLVVFTAPWPATAQGYVYQPVMDERSGEPSVIIHDGKQQTRVRVSQLSKEERLELAQSHQRLLAKLPAARRKAVEEQFQKHFGKWVPQASSASTEPADYKSGSVQLHTDLPAEEARALLKELNVIVANAGRYWGKRHKGLIECFVVRDLNRWAGRKFPADVVPKLSNREGVTLSQSRSVSLTQGKKTIVQRVETQSVVFASDRPGVPQHEIVHAFCAETFGTTGPVWYSEGMAELGHYVEIGSKSVKAPYRVIMFLRSAPHKSALTVVNEQQITGDSWKEYARRWALCHLLNYNPNYTRRFQMLGRAIVDGQKIDYRTVFGARADEIEFEYRFFIEHLAPGLRVDLCRWDWGASFDEVGSGGSKKANVDAQRGWQASGARLIAGQQYAYMAEGTWQTAKDGPELTPDGDAKGHGRLLGVIMTDMQLGEPFALGSKGSFVAPAAGKLYLRCHDAWHEIGDNSGRVTLNITAPGAG
ncbi:MAG: hypothetical protein O3C57_04610 [Verrucomicrobia bacterium]|nr:hypothetical protein [Verrucomicrobiota bacterium]